ncbi:MAG: AI-2E family transporter [Planctomycetota bacterium]
MPSEPRTTTDTNWQRLHLWQIQPLRDLGVIAAIFGLIWLGYKLSVVTVPLLLALLITYLFEPLVRRLTAKNHFSREGVAIGIIIGAGVLVVLPIIIGLGYGVGSGSEFARSVSGNLVTLRAAVVDGSDESLNELPNNAWRSAATRLREINDSLAQDRAPSGMPIEVVPELAPETTDTDANSTAEAADPPDEPPPPRRASWLEITVAGFIIDAADWAQANQARIGQQALGTFTEALGAALRFLGSLGYLLFSGFLTAFFFYFICTGYGKLLQWFEQLIPTAQRDRVIKLAKQMDGAIAGFIRGRLIIAFVLAIAFSIAYAIIGTPNAILVGLATGILGIVPYLSMVGVVLAWVFMILDPAEGARGAWWWILIGPPLVYAVVQAIDEYTLTPYIVGKSTDINAPTVLFATIAGAALGGFYGVLLAIPVAACAKIVIREIIWPKFQAWVRGEAADPLPLGDSQH